MRQRSFRRGLSSFRAYERHCSLPALAGAAMLPGIAAKKLFCRVPEDNASSLESIGKPMQKAVLFHTPPYWGYGARTGHCNDRALINPARFRGGRRCPKAGSAAMTCHALRAAYCASPSSALRLHGSSPCRLAISSTFQPPCSFTSV